MNSRTFHSVTESFANGQSSLVKKKNTAEKETTQIKQEPLWGQEQLTRVNKLIRSLAITIYHHISSVSYFSQ